MTSTITSGEFRLARESLDAVRSAALTHPHLDDRYQQQRALWSRRLSEHGDLEGAVTLDLPSDLDHSDGHGPPSGRLLTTCSRTHW